MGFIPCEYMANIHRSGARMHMKVAMTHARRPSYRSETTPS